MTYRDSQQAFQAAIESGRLSINKSQPNYAGKYMYMGTDDDGKDLFKNIDTREYDV